MAKRLNKEYLPYFREYCDIEGKPYNKTTYFKWIDVHRSNYKDEGSYNGTWMTFSEWIIENCREPVL